MQSFRYILFLMAMVVLAACGRTEEEEAYLKKLEEQGPLKEAFDVKFIFSEMAVLQAELEAPHAIEAKEKVGDKEEDIRIFDRGMHLMFYNPNGAKKSDLTSDQGTFRNQFQDAEVWGNVILINERGDRLETEKLFWSKTMDKIWTPGFVKIFTETEVIYGDSMVSNTDFTEYEIINIKGAMTLKEEL